MKFPTSKIANALSAQRLIAGGLLATIMVISGACSADEKEKPAAAAGESKANKKGNEMQVATFGGGCFWCVEAVFQRLDGVEKVVSGYMGGKVANPTYQAICTGETGHAEVCQVTYDPKKVEFATMLEVFWKTHDPTTLNRQGNDVGTQYRSVVFYHDDDQKQVAAKYKKKLDDSGAFKDPIVTEISKAEIFWPAEDYHQNYFNLNKYKNPYCRMIYYKVEKFKEAFGDKLKKEEE